MNFCSRSKLATGVLYAFFYVGLVSFLVLILVGCGASVEDISIPAPATGELVESDADLAAVNSLVNLMNKKLMVWAAQQNITIDTV